MTKRYKVVVTSSAEEDMMKLYAYIVADSGHPRAEAYINCILDALEGLETFRSEERRETIFGRA